MNTTLETVMHEKGRIDIEVRFKDGRKYVVAFCESKYLAKQLGKSKHKCVTIPAILVIDEANMQRVKEVINHVVSVGFFDHLMPVKEGQ